MQFRWHRGTFTESIATLVEVSDREALLAELARGLDREVSSQRLSADHYGFDKRVGWDAYLVHVDGVPVGFSDGPIN